MRAVSRAARAPPGRVHNTALLQPFAEYQISVVCSGLEGSRPYITLSDQLELLDTPEKVAAVETAGHTLEFLPGDNTVIQIEGTSSRITRITR